MSKVISFITTIVISFSSIADCNKPVITLLEGERSPCKGYLFSPSKELELRLMTEDYGIIQKKLELKDKQIQLLKSDIDSVEFIIKKEQEKSELWRALAEKSSLQLIKTEDSRGNRDMLMLLVGVLITVGAGYSLGQVH